MYLSDLKTGEWGRIVSVGGSGSLRQHFLDMGLIPGKAIRYVKAAPMGDPIEYNIWGYSLTLRMADAASIEIERWDGEGTDDGALVSNPAPLGKPTEHHPGLGKWGFTTPKIVSLWEKGS